MADWSQTPENAEFGLVIWLELESKDSGWEYVAEIPLAKGVTGKAYRRGEWRAIAGRYSDNEQGVAVTVWRSVSEPDRYPTWDEIKAAGYSIFHISDTVAH